MLIHDGKTKTPNSTKHHAVRGAIDLFYHSRLCFVEELKIMITPTNKQKRFARELKKLFKKYKVTHIGGSVAGCPFFFFEDGSQMRITYDNYTSAQDAKECQSMRIILDESISI